MLITKMKLYISPPFGNYLYWLPNTYAIYGSYTLYPRPGLFGQIIRTLRYSQEYKGWINKIGLRNKGIKYAIDSIQCAWFKSLHSDNLVSVAIKDVKEIPKFLEEIPEDMSLEINVSCPNTEKNMVDESIDKFLNVKRNICSIKCSPLTSFDNVDKYYQMGFRTFHFSNTLPHIINGVHLGGLSGITLIPFSENLIRYTRDKYKDVHIIAGGGVRDMETVKQYKKMGADSISISTLCFNPFSLVFFYLKFHDII
jgi:dihydroorotate dehydrogenase